MDYDLRDIYMNWTSAKIECEKWKPGYSSLLSIDTEDIQDIIVDALKNIAYSEEYWIGLTD